MYVCIGCMCYMNQVMVAHWHIGCINNYNIWCVARDPLLVSDWLIFVIVSARSVHLDQVLPDGSTINNRERFDAGAISRLKKGVVLVNTSRGDIVDERAIMAALEAKTMRSYGTDVIMGAGANTSVVCRMYECGILVGFCMQYHVLPHPFIQLFLHTYTANVRCNDVRTYNVCQVVIIHQMVAQIS